MKKILIALTLLLSACHLVKAQTRSVGGVVIDSLTNKPMEYIAVYIEKTSSGCVTNYNGEFFLTDNSDKNILVVDAIGYKTKRIVLKPGKTSGLKIKMQSESINLDGAVVKPKREKYRKKENPAVELIRNVIANKGKNSKCHSFPCGNVFRKSIPADTVYLVIAWATATATSTDAPTIGLLPIPIRPIIST